MTSGLVTPAVQSRPTGVGQVLVVANPAAAGVTTAVVTAVLDRLAADASSVRPFLTTAPGSAAQALARPGATDGIDLVVAVGGDGTVREVAAALAALPGPAPALLVLPAGSGNSTCRNLWGELELPEVLEAALDPARRRLRPVDLLRLVEPGVTVVLGASTGFLAAVLVAARDVDPAVVGRDRYLTAAVHVLGAMPSAPTRVSVDGVVLSDGPTSSVAVGGGRFRARDFQFLPDSVLDDGLLDVSTIPALDEAATAALVPLVPTGEHVRLPQVRSGRGRRVEVVRTDGRPLLAEFDGEVWDAAGSRLTVEVLPRALRVLAPLTPPCG
jgi:diacylglycerol kinase (ATP)